MPEEPKIEIAQLNKNNSSTMPTLDTMTLHVPFRVEKRGGRKRMHLPESATDSRRTENTLAKAPARALRWMRMLESGEFAKVAELAEREGVAFTYVTRALLPR